MRRVVAAAFLSVVASTSACGSSTPNAQGDVDATPGGAAGTEASGSNATSPDGGASGFVDGSMNANALDGDGTAPASTGGPVHLTVNDRARPLNVEGAPFFGWFVQDPDGNEIETAYQIQITRDRDTMQIWDSGKVPSSEQSYVAYGGPTLEPGTSYTWIVRTWDRTGQPSPWSLAAHFDTGLGDRDWGASWIRRQVSEPDDYTLARKETAIGASPVIRARAYVAASQQFELYLGGQLADRGQAFSYPGEGYYQASDVTSLVKAGQPLAIGIIYHWYGSGQGRPAGEPGLLARVVVDHQDGTHEIVVTDTSWRVRRASQWQTGAPKRNGDSGDYVEHIDARQAPSGWNQPGYDASASPWSAPQVIGAHPAGMFTHLTGQPSRLHYEAMSPVSIKALADGSIVADFGFVIPARPHVRFAAGAAGRTISLQCGYQLTSDGHVSATTTANQGTDLTFTYAEQNGAQEFLPFTFFAWRYLQISAPGETLGKDAIEAIVQHTDAPPEDAAQFTSSDATLDSVFQLVQRSSLYAAQEQFLDTPTREKGQFLGDAVNDSLATMAGSRERNTTQKALREFIASQARYWPDGRLNAVYPNGDGKRDIPDFTELFPGWAFRYFEETGDRDLLAQAYPVMKKVADYVWSYRNATTGLVTNLAGGSGQYQYGIIDWPPSSRFAYDTATIARTTVNVLAVDAQRAVSDAAGVIGQTADVDAYSKRAVDLTSAINGRLRRADGVYVDGLAAGDVPSAHASQHATSYAIAYGVAPSDDWSALAAYIAGLGMQQGPMTAHILLKALGDAGRADQTLARLTDKTGLGWANVLAQGGTFTWESWTARSAGESESHGWGSPALVDILEVLLGARVTSPGAATVLIRPPDDVLTSAHGTLPTQRGPVGVQWARTLAGGLTLDIDLPVNVRARVALPHPELGPTGSGPGAPVAMPDAGGRAIFEVGSGHSHFVVGG